MKKFLSFGMVLILSFSLAACGEGNSDKSTEDAKSTTPTEEATTAPTEEPTEEAEAPVEEAEEMDATDVSGEEETDETSDFSLADLEGILTCGYMGVANDDEETTLYLAMDDEPSFAILLMLSADLTENISFVGECTDNGDGTLTIADESSGTQITFGVKDNGDGTFHLDCGDAGSATVAGCEVSDVLKAMDIIDQNTSAVN